MKKLGFGSHVENLVVFICFGMVLALGGWAVDATSFLADGKEALSQKIIGIANEGIAMRIFLFLTILGLFGIQLLDVNKIPVRMRKIISFFCLPAFRAGISAGAISAGMLIGLGVGLSIAALIEGEPRELAFSFIGNGIFIVIVCISCFIGAAEAMNEQNLVSRIVLFIHSTLILIALFIYAREGFYWVMLAFLIVGIFAFYMAKKNKTRNDGGSNVPS